MKKFISMVLALVMALSLTTVAWGAATSVSDAEGLLDAVKADGTIELTADITTPLDIGKSDGTVARNIVIDLKGNTLTLGPAIGSTGTETNGMRVLAKSIVEIKNGTIAFSDQPNANGKNVIVGIANYGTLTLTDVEVKAGSTVQYTINNRGALTLAGTTSVANGGAGDKIAITNDPYNYVYTDFDASLTIDSAAVSVGTVQVERYGNDQNDGVVVLNISAGYVEEIVEDGATAVAVDGNISGGSFGTLPDESYLADGVELVDDGTGNYIAATATTGNTAATKFYVADENATDGWKLLASLAGVKPAELFVEADYDEEIPAGNLDHYVIDGEYYVVATKNAAEYKLVYGGNAPVYLVAVDEANVKYEAQADVFTGVTTDEDACGKVLVKKSDLSKTYYAVTLEDSNGVENTFYLVKVKADGETTLLVNGKIVEADFVGDNFDAYDAENAFIFHDWAGNDVDEDGYYTTVKCAHCGKVAKLYANADAAGKDSVYVSGFGWITDAAASYVSASASTGKVQSAETFDAGIAMYVGMSVMAAAGSAVVLKKRED